MGRTELQGHSRYVSSVAFSLDGTCVVYGSEDNSVRILNVDSGEIERVEDGLTGCPLHSHPMGRW